MRFLGAILLLFFSFTGFAQKHCGSKVYDSLMHQRHSYWSEEAFHHKLNQEIKFHKRAKLEVNDSLYTIPVVIHVVYSQQDLTQNISDQQIFSQIDVLNEDYRAVIPSTYIGSPAGADVKIQFKLASTDPSGNYTTGITRTPTTVTSGFDIYNDDEKLKALAYWPSDKYMNIWVTDLAGYLGYAQFPDSTNLNGLDPVNGPGRTDGVVIDYQNFGRKIGTNTKVRYNLGRTATHEIGHFFGLKHTWGDESDCTGDDYCTDTPPCSGQFFASLNSCQKPIQCSTFARQTQNFMDYSDDACMFIFTQDQKNRMRTALLTSPRRKSLLKSNVFTGVPPVVIDSTIAIYNTREGQVIYATKRSEVVQLFDLQGKLLRIYTLDAGNGVLDTYGLLSGVYIIQTASFRKKLFIL